ncbi:MAG: hypothetical protein MZV70_37355 [Desulfobacterales bacterium]|nr:hypothetical protein [Desulfobacterales bacterium]
MTDGAGGGVGRQLAEGAAREVLHREHGCARHVGRELLAGRKGRLQRREPSRCPRRTRTSRRSRGSWAWRIIGDARRVRQGERKDEGGRCPAGRGVLPPSHGSLPWPTLAPLFWQHGEPHDVLRRRDARHARRRHQGLHPRVPAAPRLRGSRWWSDLDAIVAEAKRLGMQVWIFDDKVYPTGFANGAIRPGHPEAAKRFLRRERIEAIGPLLGASFRVGAWCASGETLLAAVAGRLADDQGTIDPSSLVDVTPAVRDGVLYWDVPPGRWRVYVVVVTPTGGEEWTKDYLNPLDPAATRVLLDAVYEPHYARYRDEFGRTIAGFFSDEPRFGNAGTYDARIGRLPHGAALARRHARAAVRSVGRELRPRPALPVGRGRAPRGPGPGRVHGSRLPALRGRLLPAHRRLVPRPRRAVHRPRGRGQRRAHAASGTGRAISSARSRARTPRASTSSTRSGPATPTAGYLTPFGDLDARFFAWGIAKLASSAAHLDPLKNGATACEIFGAYGWRLGLRMMKWLTDHACVRGATPADSPRVLAEGVPRPGPPAPLPRPRHEPAVAPLRRVVGVRRPGVPRAVGRHARRDRRRAVPRGGGVVGRFVRAVRIRGARARRGADRLRRGAGRHARRSVGGEARARAARDRGRALRRSSWCRTPRCFRRRCSVACSKLRDRACPSCSAGPSPARRSGTRRSATRCLAALRRHRSVRVARRPRPSPRPCVAGDLHDVATTPAQPHLRVYHYRKDGRDTWFLVNESLREPVDAALTLQGLRGSGARVGTRWRTAR